MGFGLLLGPMLAEQGAAVGGRVEGDYQDLREWLRPSPSLLIQRLARQLPAGMAPTPTPDEAGARTLQALAQIMACAGLVGDGLFVSAAVMLLAFYWTVERERVLRWLLLLLPAARRAPAREFITATEGKN